MPGLRSFRNAAETTTSDGNNVVTSEADTTYVTMAATDAVTSLSTDKGVSTEGSTQQTTQEASSSLPPVSGKLHLDNSLSYIKLVNKMYLTQLFAMFAQFTNNTPKCTYCSDVEMYDCVTVNTS